jgi:hypothetical protein
MACTSCGGNRNVKKPGNNTMAVVRNTNGLGIRDWILSLGWQYIGKCGCSENKSMYRHDKYPKWEVEISPLGDRLEMWRLFDGNDKKKKGVGGPQNYENVYTYWINYGENLQPK